MKKGIVECADIIVVNKADGELLSLANKSASFYFGAVHTSQPKVDFWGTKVTPASSHTGYNIDYVWKLILEYRKVSLEKNHFYKKRHFQTKNTIWEIAKEDLYTLLNQRSSLNSNIDSIFSLVDEYKIPPSMAASFLLKLFSKDFN